MSIEAGNRCTIYSQLIPPSLSHLLSLCLTHTHTLTLLHTPTLHCQWAALWSAAFLLSPTIENFLIVLSEDKHAPVNLTAFSSSSLWLSADYEQKRFPLFTWLNNNQSHLITSSPACRTPPNLLTICLELLWFFTPGEIYREKKKSNISQEKKKGEMLRAQGWQDGNNEEDREVIHPTN